ncbi:hypothetical protein EDD15DRAFT_2531071 [Pisolithus albus]|nr:hypothetical protein EDD15DRAFT_2531071 [Pisolithus albus]
MARGQPRKAATQWNQQGSVLEDAGLTCFPESDSSTSSEHPCKRARSCSSRHSQPSTDDSGDDWQPPVIFESLKCAAGGDESDEADDIEDIGAAFPDNGRDSRSSSSSPTEEFNNVSSWQFPLPLGLASKSPHTPRTFEAPLKPFIPHTSALEHTSTDPRTSPEPSRHLFEPSTTSSKPHTTLEPSIYLISHSRGFATPTSDGGFRLRPSSRHVPHARRLVRRLGEVSKAASKISIRPPQFPPDSARLTPLPSLSTHSPTNRWQPETTTFCPSPRRLPSSTPHAPVLSSESFRVSIGVALDSEEGLASLQSFICASTMAAHSTTPAPPLDTTTPTAPPDVPMDDVAPTSSEHPTSDEVPQPSIPPSLAITDDTACSLASQDASMGEAAASSIEGSTTKVSLMLSGPASLGHLQPHCPLLLRTTRPPRPSPLRHQRCHRSCHRGFRPDAPGARFVLEGQG